MMYHNIRQTFKKQKCVSNVSTEDIFTTCEKELLLSANDEDGVICSVCLG